MKIAVSGHRGLIGTALCHELAEAGHELVLPGRRDLYGSPEELAALIHGCDAVVHLAGAPILSRWTTKGKARILESRIIPTQNLATAIRLCTQPPAVFISASAVGIYDDRPAQSEYDFSLGHDFPAEVCRAWESASGAEIEGCKKIIIRLGIVLSGKGGALKRMLPAFRFWLGGPIAGGRQQFSWIHLRDVCGAIQFLLTHPAEGIFNLTAPESLTNRAFSKALGANMHRPSWINIPAFALKLLYGQAARMLITGKDVRPIRLTEAGYTFQYPDISSALRQCLSE
jgi:uncharacterized protein (TIGR01777 family)